MKNFRKFAAVLILLGLVALAPLVFFLTSLGDPLYDHVGYLTMPKEEALQFAASHSETSQITAYSGEDEWAVTYNFRDTNPEFKGIQGKSVGTWLVGRWVLLVIAEILFTVIGLFLLSVVGEV